jgi:uncharacterized membrane protein YdjX (TVP38/TMEM64 family)
MIVTEKHRKILWLTAVLIFIIFCAAVTFLVGTPMVRMAENPEGFREWVDSFGIWGRLIFVGMVVLQVLVAFIPGEPIEIAAGYAFGFWEGTVLTMLGFLIGSWLVFTLVRKFGVKLVEVFFPNSKLQELSVLKNPKKTRIVAFILMLIPGTPKDFISYFAGLTQLKVLQWLLIVTVARIPSLVTSTITGAAAGEQNYTLSVVMLAIALVISGFGILYYRKISKMENE